MSKKKSGKALFEVITTYRQKHPGTGPLMPEWMRRRTAAEETPDMPELRPEPVDDAAAAPQPALPAASPYEIPLASAAPTEPQPLRTASVAEPEPYEPREIPSAPLRPAGPPIVSREGGRLVLSFNYVTTVVAMMGLVVLLVGMYLLGRANAPVAGKPASQPAKTAGTPEPKKPAENPTPPRRHRETETTPKIGLVSSDLPKGKFFLVIAVIRGGDGAEQKAEAVRIAEYCNSSNLPASVRVPATAATWQTKEGEKIWVVVANEPFTAATVTPRAKALQAKVWALGARQENPTTYSFRPDDEVRLRENQG